MIFPIPGGLSLNIAAHIVFGTWGMYRFLRKRNLSELGSIFGALSFGLMPKIAAHFGAGHVSLIYAISWTPWLFYFSEHDKKGWKTGLIAGAIFLADPRWSVYAGLIWISYEIAHRHFVSKVRLNYYARAALVAFLISSPLLISLAEYLQFSSRASLAAGDILYGSLPAANLIGLIIPGSSGNTEWYSYAGGSLLALFFAQLLIKELRKANRFWIIWIGVSILLAMGSWGIEADWINRIPIFNLLRVPARSLFLVGFCLAIIGGLSFDDLILNGTRSKNNRIISFVISIFGLMMLGGIIVLAKDQPLMIAWGFLAFFLCGVILMVIQLDLSPKYLAWIMIGILSIDLLCSGLAAYQVQDKEIWGVAQDLSILIDDDEIFRIYSPSYSVGQHLAAEFGLELADGVDPMQLAAYVEYMEDATGVNQSGYSVTIPPFNTGNPSVDNSGSVPNSGLLGLLNVKYLVSEFEMNSTGLEIVQDQGDLYIYKNSDTRPRAWIEGNGESGNALGSAKIIDRSPNSIHLEATGPGLLVISEIDYPGWQVVVDGKRADIESSYGILRSVSLGDGEHRVDFRFRPLSTYIGIFLAVCGWTFVAYEIFRNRNQSLKIKEI